MRERLNCSIAKQIDEVYGVLIDFLFAHWGENSDHLITI